MGLARAGVLLAALLAVLVPAAASAALPVVAPGDAIGRASSATLFAPAALHADVRVRPRADAVLYITGGAPTVAMRVTVVQGARRRVLIARDDLPAHAFGVRLPPDAPRADRIVVDATLVRGGAVPQLVDASMLAQSIADGWSGIALCGVLAGLAVIFGALALAQRSAASGWYAVMLAAEAGIALPWLGIARPPPIVGQPLHAALTTLTLTSAIAFTLAFFGRDRLPAWVPTLLWSMTALQVVDAVGADLFTDLWQTPLRGWLDAGTILVQALAGVLAWRRGAPGAGYFVAAMVTDAIDYLIPATTAVIALGDVVSNAVEALLFAFAIAVALRAREHDRLHFQRLAQVDGLTGIANRRAFESSYRVAWDRAARSGAPLAAMMIDVDHFKRYNDAFGHLAGDETLRLVAREIGTGATRHDDIVARYGGEEFVVVLPATDAPGALQAAERIRLSIEQLALPHVLPFERVTVSVGVAVEAYAASGSPSALLARADAALYVAKTHGRDRVVLDALPAVGTQAAPA